MGSFFLYKRGGVITNKTVIKKSIDSLEDGNYLVTVESAKKRTLPQNAYYFGVVVPMVYEGLKAAGFDTVRSKEDAHLVMKALFLKNHFVNPETGEGVEWVGSTKKLKTVEFNEYLEKIWQWSAEYLNVNIPSPNSQAAMFESG